MECGLIMSQQLILGKTGVTAASLLFTALSNDCRVGILNLLRNGPKNVGEIAGALKIEQTMASHNLTSQRFGKTIEYTLNRETVEPILRLADKHISKYAINLRTCKTLER